MHISAKMQNNTQPTEIPPQQDQVAQQSRQQNCETLVHVLFA